MTILGEGRINDDFEKDRRQEESSQAVMLY